MNIFLHLSYIILVEVPKKEMLSNRVEKNLSWFFKCLGIFRLLEEETEVEEGETNASDYALFLCGYLRLYVFKNKRFSSYSGGDPVLKRKFGTSCILMKILLSIHAGT